MPEYLYRCNTCKRELPVVEPMDAVSVIFCPDCGMVMHRKPLRVRVNWGGLKPSQGGIHPKIKEFIDDAPRRREEGL